MNKYTSAEVRQHNSAESLWLIIHGYVYDVTQFHIEHPGGTEVHLNAAGKDTTGCFESVGHSDEAKSLMNSFRIGQIVNENSGTDTSVTTFNNREKLKGIIEVNQESNNSQQPSIKIGEEYKSTRFARRSAMSENWIIWWLIALVLIVFGNVGVQFIFP